MRKKLLLIGTVAIITATIFTGCSGDAVETFTENTENEAEVAENNSEEAETVEPTAVPTEKPVATTAPTTAPTEKPVETATPTATPTTKPVETAKPVETTKPAATPAPTVKPVHTHSYVLVSSTSGATCTSTGVDTYKCDCGDSYTTSNGNTGSHTWTTENWTETIHFDAVYGAERGYMCGCGIFWADTSEYHNNHEMIANCGYTTSVREYEVSPAHDEVVTHSRTYCTSCGREQ